MFSAKIWHHTSLMMMSKKELRAATTWSGRHCFVKAVNPETWKMNQFQWSKYKFHMIITRQPALTSAMTTPIIVSIIVIVKMRGRGDLQNIRPAWMISVVHSDGGGHPCVNRVKRDLKSQLKYFRQYLIGESLSPITRLIQYSSR